MRWNPPETENCTPAHKLHSVYCSAATKEMLLRLERYPCRINYASGILETRTQRYRHLKSLLVRIRASGVSAAFVASANSL